MDTKKTTAGPSLPVAATPPAHQGAAMRDRRAYARHPVDAKANIILVKSGSVLRGAIVDLSLGGCRIQCREKFPVGIYTRVETEFYLGGLPFLLAGVVQAIHDRQTVGIRFLDLSPRKRDQIQQLIHEIEELRTGSPISADDTSVQ